MISRSQNHLEEDRIILAVIDQKDLTEADQHHLQECEHCNGKVIQLKEELLGLGENARQSVPQMSKNIVLPREEQSHVRSNSSWFPSFAAAAIAGLVLFVYFLGMESMTPRMMTLQNPDALLEDEYLMEEIYEMVESPFSDELYEITGGNGGFDDEFLQFIVPDIPEDFQSGKFIKGGTDQC